MIKEIDEKSPANFRNTKNGIASYFGNRNIMMLIDIHSFCKKYGLSCKTLNNVEDPIDILIDAVQTMAIKNEFKRVGENKDAISYNKYSVVSNGDHLFYGYFTDDEATDISKVTSKLKVIR